MKMGLRGLLSTSHACGYATAAIRLLPMTVETVRKGDASALSLRGMYGFCVSFIKTKISVLPD